MSEAPKVESSGTSKMQQFLAWVICGLMFIVVTFLLFREIPEKNKETVLMLIGALVIVFKDVVGYSFGSSAGSARKDEQKDILQKQIIQKDELLLKKENGAIPSDMLGQTKAALLVRIKEKPWEQEMIPMIDKAATLSETIILQALIADKEKAVT